jgi:hypothetical protein
MSLGSFFKSFMTFLLPVAKAAIPVVGGVATASNPIVGAVIEGVPALMDAVEAISPKSNGAAKANAVQAAAKVMFDGLSATLTGGAKESFTTYQPLIQAVIDSGIAAVNAQPGSAPAASTDPAK